MLRSLLAVGLALVVGACGGGGGDDDSGGGGDGGAGGVDGGGGGGVDGGGTPSGWTELITGTWTLAAGSESYWCARKTVTEDMYIVGLRAVAPTGTHHTVVSVVDNSGVADGEQSCGPGTLSDQMLFASGVGTDELLFPPGVAVKVSAGQQVLLNLHLFNVDEASINGTSGTEVKLVPASEVEELAEMVFAGTFLINIPAGQMRTINGGCTFTDDQQVIMLWPHMHQYGTHMKATLDGTTIHDDDYSFYEQVNYPLDTPLQVNAGQTINVQCTYMNTSGSNVTFGDSSEDEMCFLGLYRYPASAGGDIFCTNDGF